MTPRKLGPGSPRLHHFIPRWFLQNFADNGRVARIDLDDPMKHVVASVEKVAAERDLYTVGIPGVGLSSHVEDELTKIDGRAAAPVKYIASTGELDLSVEDRRDVEVWLASMWVRGPRWRRQQEAIADLAIKQEILGAPDLVAVCDILSRSLGRSVSDTEAEELLAKTSAGGMEFVPLEPGISMRMLDTLWRYADDLRDFRWELARNLTSPLFLPDMPVVVQPVVRSLSDGPERLQRRIIQLPLAPRVLLSLFSPTADSMAPARYFDPWLHVLRKEMADWAFAEIYCQPSTAMDVGALVGTGSESPLLINQGAKLGSVWIDGMDRAPLRRRPRRIRPFLDAVDFDGPIDERGSTGTWAT